LAKEFLNYRGVGFYLCNFRSTVRSKQPLTLPSTMLPVCDVLLQNFIKCTKKKWSVN